MIKYIEGNLFESNAQVLVNTVNTDGVMGKGIAKTFKEIYPIMFEKYKSFCENGQLDVGMLYLYKTDNKWILNFPTKTSWKKQSRLEYIEKGLEKFVDTYNEKNINSIAFPQLGCGNGNLDWKDVKPIMEKYLGDLPINVEIYVKIFENIPEHLETKYIKTILGDKKSYIDFHDFVMYFGNDLLSIDGMSEHLAFIHTRVVDGDAITRTDIENIIMDINKSKEIFDVIKNMPYFKKVIINGEPGVRIKKDLELKQVRIDL